MSAEFTICQECQGRGRGPDGRRCATCRGVGRAVRVGDNLVCWKYDDSLTATSAQRLARVGQLLTRFVAFSIGVTGLAFAIIGTVAGLSGENFAPLRWVTDRGSAAYLFWWGVLAACYVYYSLDRELAETREIPRRQFPSAESAPAVSLVMARAINVADTMTSQASQATREAAEFAQHLKQPLQPLHIFCALTSYVDVRVLLARLGVPWVALRDKALRVLAGPPSGVTIEGMMIEAYRRAVGSRRHHLDPLLLFLASASLDPLIREVLADFRVDEDRVANVVAWIWNDDRQRNRWRRFRHRAQFRPRNRLDRAMTALATPLLDHYSEDLTELAQWGYFQTAGSRSEVSDEVLRVLQSGRSALLVGYAGVGKREIIEDLAERLVADDVPATFTDKRLVGVVLPRLVSGATPAEAEDRLIHLVDEAARAGNIILVMEGLHGLVGITSGQAGSIGLPEALARSLSGRRMLCVATTTPEGDRQFIASSALAPIFQSVRVEEPNVNQTIQIVEARLAPVEYRQRVYFSYDAIARLVELSARFIHDTRLPRKALGLLPELAIFVRERRGANTIVLMADVNDFFGTKFNLPVSQVSAERSALLLNLEERIHQRLVNQEEAVVAVATALRRAAAEVRDRKRPIVNLLFLGPTGVGKTELAKAVAEAYFGDERHMLRFDMTEYQESPSLSRLIGEASGGPAAHGLLTEAVRGNPFALVLFDEVEKAHRDILNVLLQVMDEGRLTDSRGEAIDFTNVILIATSNAGAQYVREAVRAGTPSGELERQLVEQELKPIFQPEFLNRFDRIVVFHSLSSDHLEAIAWLLLQELTRRLGEQGISFTATVPAVRALAAAGFDPSFGARPLRRVIQERVSDPIAHDILAGQIRRRDRVTLTDTGELQVESAPPL